MSIGREACNSPATNYLIDGMDNNEQFLGGAQCDVPTGTVTDVTVLTSTYSAEYGRPGNGIFNVTTKSGSNEWSGEGFCLVRPGQRLDGSFTSEASQELAQRDLSRNHVKSGSHRGQGGFAVGGPS